MNMSEETSDEELKKRIKQLEKEVVDLKRKEIELKTNKKRYHVEIDNIPVGFFRFAPSPEESFIMGNPAVTKMFGYETLEEFLKASVRDLFWDIEDYKSFSKKLISSGDVAAEEVKLKRHDGTLVWGAITANAIHDDSGVKYYYGIVEDITDRKKAEQLLMEEKNFSETVIESMPGLFFMLDEDYRYVKWNNNAQKIYGYELDEIFRLGMDGVVVKEDIPELVKSLERARRGESGYAEYSIISKDGRKIPLAGEACSVNIEGSDYLIGMEIDISKRINVEEKLRKTLKELNKLKDQLEAENVYLLEQINYERAFGEIVGKSRELKYVLFKVKQVASTDSTVLIQGETGVGKDMVAQTIHNLSKLKDHTMVKVNCASLPPSLIENELFGHEKGAFTGANTRKLGRFEIANGSTIFLDEISELPLELQAKLLRVVEEGEMERLGSTRTIKIDVRIIAATNRDLEDEVRRGRFREDLWYRLNVFPITVPPLRDRKEDITLLVEYFVSQLSTRMGKSINKIPQRTMNAFIKYPWPGNIRELRNVIERAVISTNGYVLNFADQLKMPMAVNNETYKDKSLAEMERDYITRILEKMDWRISGPRGAANILDLKESTLRARMKKLGVSRIPSVSQF